MLTKSSGQKRHNDYRYVKVGRISMNSWPNRGLLPVGDIYVSERDLVHIDKRHGAVLALLGLEPLDYIVGILRSCSEIRYDGNVYYFVPWSDVPEKLNCAIVEMSIYHIKGKITYIIKSAYPIKRDRLKKIKLICERPRNNSRDIRLAAPLCR